MKTLKRITSAWAIALTGIYWAPLAIHGQDETELPGDECVVEFALPKGRGVKIFIRTATHTPHVSYGGFNSPNSAA